jgi:4-hydroxyphenylacetate 3-monooxygenase
MAASQQNGSATAGSGARRGEQVLQRLREQPPTIWYRGEQVKDVTTHPAFRGGVQTLASLYDLQWQNADTCLYDSPTSGKKVARSFMMPKTHDELHSVTLAMKVWEDYTHGMMGRVPDYINRAMTGYAAGAPFLAEADPRFGENVVKYYEYLRENDLCLTFHRRRIAPRARRSRPIRSWRRASRRRRTRASSSAAAACWRRCRSRTRSWCFPRRC